MISTIWDKVLRRTGIKSAINLYKVGKKVRSDQKIKIVFFCQLPHLWSCIESIYVEAEKDSEIEAYVLAIPNKWEDEVDTDAYDFCVQSKYNVIMAFDESKKTFFDLKSFNPDYVFIPRPYDVYLPEQYRGDVISNYTKVCYVCYGYAAEGGHILETCYNRAFTNNCYFLFPENDSTEEYCKRKHVFTSLFGLRKIVKTPFPRFDLLQILYLLRIHEYPYHRFYHPAYISYQSCDQYMEINLEPAHPSTLDFLAINTPFLRNLL